MRHTVYFIFGLLFFFTLSFAEGLLFTPQVLAQSASTTPAATASCPVNKQCSKDADCQTGSACGNMYCDIVAQSGLCKERAPTPGATTATGIPLASPCNSWNEINDQGKVIGQNAIKWKPGDPYPTLPEGRKFKCATVDTAIGSIQTDPVKLIQQLFGILLSLAGGIALLLIIYSGYQIMTSEGNPEKLQAARETLTSAIIGLVFLIFSLVILQIIGVDILRLPGFTK